MLQEKEEKMQLLNRLKSFFHFFKIFSSEYMRMNATQSIINEYSELLNTFLLILFADYIGMPSPPKSVTLRILPLALDEFKNLLTKGKRIDDQLGDLWDALNIEV